ncbi:MAG TPA: arginine--tRNA ligase [Ktedonobacterales bacterium]
MIRDTIWDIVAHAVAALQESGELPPAEVPAFDITYALLEERGDDDARIAMRQANALRYATNVAMKLAAALRASGALANPRALAETIAAHIRETVAVVPAYELVREVEVAGPGFINLYLDPAWLLAQTGAIVQAGDQFGAVDAGRGRAVNLEFVSANPTGPVTVGNGRGAFIGDTLGNIMRAAGYAVTKEYYFNDAGGQIARLGFSMERYCRFVLGEPVSCRLADKETESEAEVAKPSDKYRKDKASSAAGDHESAADGAAGDDARGAHAPKPGKPKGYYSPYYEGVAARLLERHGRALLDLPDGERHDRIGAATAALIMEDIQETMRRMKVEFDVWFNQASLEPSGQLQAAIESIRANGYLEEHDGATWMKSSQFGDDQDRVIIRRDGLPTYITSDIAYMRNKFERGFQTLIYVLGPDHHGYIGRLQATSGMLGHDPHDAHVLQYGQVNLKQGGKAVKMGKRLGTAVTLDDLYEDVGADVARFFFLMRGNDTPLDFDLDLARKQSSDNPGLSVQYAHARVCGVFRKARTQRFTPAKYAKADMGALAADPPAELAAELALLRQLLRLEEVVERAATALEPHHLTRYGMDLAEAYHLFYDTCPILKQGTTVAMPVKLARLRLMEAARTGLARTLALLGMDAPERMERAGASEAPVGTARAGDGD